MKTRQIVMRSVNPSEDRMDNPDVADGQSLVMENGYWVARTAGLAAPGQFGAVTSFALLPSTSVAAGTDPFFTESGTGTEVVSQAAKGGTRLTSQASTPADGDNVLLAAVANTGVTAPISATNLITFETRVMFDDIAEMFASIGLNENVTDADPTGTAGEGAMFLFDPTEEVTTGLTTAQHANWILAHKVNGADTFTATTIPVAADQDYKLKIVIGTDLKAKFYIDGLYVGQGPALTLGDTVKSFAGLELTATPAGQKSIDIRYIGLSREMA